MPDKKQSALEKLNDTAPPLEDEEILKLTEDILDETGDLTSGQIYQLEMLQGVPNEDNPIDEQIDRIRSNWFKRHNKKPKDLDYRNAL